jgi:prevent-host-death family protein
VEILTANEAKTNFGELLLKSQKSPVQITRSGKAVAVMISIETYEAVEAFKMRYLKEKLARSKNDVGNGYIVDGPKFFDDLLAGKYN